MTQATQALENLDHRGAVGSDGLTGDGVGMLTQLPHLFFRKQLKEKGIDVDNDGDIAVGVFFLPGAASGISASAHRALLKIVDDTLIENGLAPLLWRKVRSAVRAGGATCKDAAMERPPREIDRGCRHALARRKKR